MSSNQIFYIAGIDKWISLSQHGRHKKLHSFIIFLLLHVLLLGQSLATHFFYSICI